MGASQSTQTETSIHQFTVKDARGKDVDLGTYKGKVLLVVNVASKCGFTESNYTQLTELHNKCKDKVLTSRTWYKREAAEFACTRYKAAYPIFQKVRVNGPKTAPVYKFLKESQPGCLGNRIKWNFTKFLVDKNGKVIARYGPTTKPLYIEKDIQKALEKQ